MIEQETRHIPELIQQFNQGRDKELLTLKYQAMRANSFSFFRGTCHLFYQDWPVGGSLDNAPLAWICGDLHLENFGSFKGDNRLVYFDLNDFDEAILSPCTWDVARFLTSIFLAADNFSYSQSDASALAKFALDSYVEALSIGHVYTIETATAQGAVKDLLDSLYQRKRETFLDTRTELINGQRQLKIDHKRTFPVETNEIEKVTSLIEVIANERKNPNFFRVLDVTGRIAGTGSLGLERYAILVEGKGSPDRNYLLDLKAQPGSVLQNFTKVAQPQWKNEAQRRYTIQKNMQGTSPAILSPIEFEQKSFLLKELQPQEDKINLKVIKEQMGDFRQLLKNMAQLTAWAQLRASGRDGSDIADCLIEFASEKQWQGEILNYCQNYCQQVKQDYQIFCQSQLQP